MHTDQHVSFSGNVAFYEGEMMLTVGRRAVEMQGEVAIVGGQLDHLDPLDQFLARTAELDEGFNGAQTQAMLFSELHQVRKARHGAVVIEDFTEDPDGAAPGQA